MIDLISVDDGYYWVKLFHMDTQWEIVEIRSHSMNVKVIIGMGNSDFPVEPRFIVMWGPKIEPPE